MQTKHGIFGPYVFLQSAPGVEAGNLSGPCVARFDSGNEGLADPKLSGDIGLFSTCQDLFQYAGVALVEIGHSFFGTANDLHRVIGTRCFHYQKRTNLFKEALTVRHVGNSVGVKLPKLGRSPIVLDRSKAHAVADVFEGRKVRVGDADAHPNFGGVNLYAALPVHEASHVRPELRGVHMHVWTHFEPIGLQSMAVPVMRWTGRRIMEAEETGRAQDVAGSMEPAGMEVKLED